MAKKRTIQQGSKHKALRRQEREREEKALAKRLARKKNLLLRQVGSSLDPTAAEALLKTVESGAVDPRLAKKKRSASSVRAAKEALADGATPDEVRRRVRVKRVLTGDAPSAMKLTSPDGKQVVVPPRGRLRPEEEEALRREQQRAAAALAAASMQAADADDDVEMARNENNKRIVLHERGTRSTRARSKSRRDKKRAKITQVSRKMDD